MRSMQSTSSSSLLPRSLSHYEKLTTARLLQKKGGGAFLLRKPHGPFSSDWAKLFAFVSNTHSHVLALLLDLRRVGGRA